MARNLRPASGAEPAFSFRFRVLGTYRARGEGEPHVTVSMMAGRGDHLVYAGTLTLSEGEYQALQEALAAGLGDRVDFEDHGERLSVPEAAARTWP